MRRWSIARRATGRRLECPACRAAWRGDDPALPRDEEGAAAEQASEAAGSRDEGYLNLAALVPGTAAARDTSTYSPWLEVHQRRRERAEMLGSPP